MWRAPWCRAGLSTSLLAKLNTRTIQAIGNSAGANTAMLARRRRRIETPSTPVAASIYSCADGHATASPPPARRKKTSITARTNAGAKTVAPGVNARNMIELPGYRLRVGCAADTHRAREGYSPCAAKKTAGRWATVQLALTEYSGLEVVQLFSRVPAANNNLPTGFINSILARPLQ